MGDSNFIEDIWVSACTIADHHTRSVDQRNDILNYGGILPNVIGSAAAESDFRGCCLDALIDRGKACIERHHDGDQRKLDFFVIRNRENAWPLAAWPEIT